MQAIKAVKQIKPLTKAEQKILASLQERNNAMSLHDVNTLCKAGGEINEHKNDMEQSMLHEGAIAQPVSSLQATLNERSAKYGDFLDHANIAQDIQAVMRESVTKGPSGPNATVYYPGWEALRPYQKQALTVIADKIARILSGDPDYADNWHDIQGYAKLVEDSLS